MRYSERFLKLMLSIGLGASGAWLTDMRAEDGPAKPLAAEDDESRTYGVAAPSVFRIEANAGQGSGFLADASGLVLTNFHVVRRSRYIGVQIDERRKFLGQLVAADEDRDIAVVRVHPEAVAGLAALPLLPVGEQPAVGTRVVAIGSPLAQQSVLTAGRIGRVQEGVILSDVSINPGNSGGPLLDLGGRVIGINTFGMAAEQGPGLSGILPIHLARPVLAEALAAAAQATPPSIDALPVVPTTPYPIEGLHARGTDALGKDGRRARVEAGPFRVQVLTPPLQYAREHWFEIKAAERQAKRRSKGRTTVETEVAGTYQWQRSGAAYDPVVVFEVRPEARPTGGSIAASLVGAMFLAPMPVRYRFKQDFGELRLLRDGQEVVPIFPARDCGEHLEYHALGVIDDAGCVGQYLFRPGDFSGSHRYEIEVVAEAASEPSYRVALEPAIVEMIVRDFAALGEGDAPERDALTARAIGP